MNLPSSRSYGSWLAVVRFLTGCIWIIHAVPKFIHAADFLPPNGAFGQYVTQGIAKVGAPYHDFLVGVVQPNALVFAELVRFGELLVGISLGHRPLLAAGRPVRHRSYGKLHGGARRADVVQRLGVDRRMLDAALGD